MPDITQREEEIAFYFQFGCALADWTNIEAQLLDATLRCIASKEELSRAAIALGFGNIQGFRNKLFFTGATVERVLATANPAVILGWTTILEKLSRERTKRNHMAHYLVSTFPKESEGRRIALCPWSKPKNADVFKPPPGA